MNLNVYSLFDQAAEAFTQPFFLHNDGLAIRAFQDNVNAPDTNVGQHPEQFTLFKLGSYNDTNGELSPITPTSIALGVELKNPTDTNNTEKLLQEILKKVTK